MDCVKNPMWISRGIYPNYPRDGVTTVQVRCLAGDRVCFAEAVLLLTRESHSINTRCTTPEGQKLHLPATYELSHTTTTRHYRVEDAEGVIARNDARLEMGYLPEYFAPLLNRSANNSPIDRPIFRVGNDASLPKNGEIFGRFNCGDFVGSLPQNCG